MLAFKVVDFEHSVNDTVLDSYCYLTLEQGIVRAGTMQRNEGASCCILCTVCMLQTLRTCMIIHFVFPCQGCHTDGFQGSRIQPKLR